MKYLIAFIALISVAGLAQAQINKCVDASGKTVYSQGPCPKGAKASSVSAAPPAATSAAKAGDPAKAGAGAGAAAKSAAPKSAAELDQEFRKRQTDQANAAKKDEDKQTREKLEKENCDSSRQQLTSLEIGGRQSSINAAGERVFLDDAQIEAQKQRARQGIATYCK